MIRYLFVVCLIVGFTPKMFAQTMGVKSKTRVLVVGISDYQDEKITDLKFAHKDAEAFVAFMQSDAGGRSFR